MSMTRHHAEWRALLEVSVPFLALEVLDRAFPQGLDKPGDESAVRTRLKLAYEEWQESDDPAIHQAFLDLVLREVLGLDERVLASGQGIPAALKLDVPEHGTTLRPDRAVLAEGEAPRMLVSFHPGAQALDRAVVASPWPTSPETRMMELCHATGVPLGLVTNGERWVLVHAPPRPTAGERTPTSYVGFYTSLWLEEPLTLRAFRALLGVARFFAVAEGATLPALFADSAKHQQEVTDQLGHQVRRAVEVLVQAIDKVNRDRGGELLRGTNERRLYEAAVTFMMRLVFALTAEERRLFPLGEQPYDASYAVGTLRDQLRETADRHGEEVLERRHDAYSRLLATFRAIHGGVQYGRMRLPAYGGSLFDPDRFPFLEGRTDGSKWREVPAAPLPIHNRTVLHLLEALQILSVRVAGGGAEAQRLSFRALGVEQIGHVYEGLLDHTAARARETVLGLAGAKGGETEIAVAALDKAREKSDEALVALLRERTGKGEGPIRKAIAYQIPKEDHRLLTACENLGPVYQRVSPYAGLIREDSSGYPVVYPKGSVYVTTGDDRRSTGTHYTPPELTEPMVQHTLDPLVYEGPAEGKPQGEWVLKAPAEILKLRVCDLAMGSGAFLVQACRYLGAKLVEGWARCEREGGGRLVVTPEGELSQGRPEEQPLPRDVDERLLLAMRYVADRCLYGVDRNPMAVEMGKLSLWLTTMHKGRPFTFVDHALRAGDSLLGLTSAEQLERFHLDPRGGKPVLGANVVGPALKVALEKRRQLEGFTVRDPADSKLKERLFKEAQAATKELKVVANLLVGAGLAAAGAKKPLDDALRDLGLPVSGAFGAKGEHRVKAFKDLKAQAAKLLGGRRPFHWVLEFPEVMAGSDGVGFDAMVGNPPFRGGTLATTELGDDYMTLVRQLSPPWNGKADLAVGFLKRASQLVDRDGLCGLVATSAILRGESFDSFLGPLGSQGGVIVAADKPYPWPGAANVEAVDVVWASHWKGVRTFEGRRVDEITVTLNPVRHLSGAPGPLSNSREPATLAGAPLAFMGLKLCPANREVPAGELGAVPKAFRALMAQAVGGAELYNDPPGAWPWVVDPRQIGTGTASDKALLVRYKHSRPAKELYERLATATFAFACAETSTAHLAFVRVSTGGEILLRHKLIVFPTDSWGAFALLQSDLHLVWAWEWGLRRKSDLVYSPKRCAGTFPLADEGSAGLARVGEAYHLHREGLARANDASVTKTYNRFHDPSERDPAVQKLRDLHVEMDQAVAAAYGWTNLDLGHGFHETKQGIRYTLAESSRQEVLARLLELNHARYAEEVAAGLHEKDAMKKARAAKAAPPPEEKEPAPQLGLFDAPAGKGSARKGAKAKR